MKFFVLAVLSAVVLSACEKPENQYMSVVTLKEGGPDASGKKRTLLQADDQTILVPTKTLEFVKKQRALVTFYDRGEIEPEIEGSPCKWISVELTGRDTIYTKPVSEPGSIENNSTLDVYRSWVNSIEDNYLTILIDAAWNDVRKVHTISLEATEEPYVFELKHNKGEDGEPVRTVSGVIAFDMEGRLPSTAGSTVTIKYKGNPTVDYKDGKDKAIYWKLNEEGRFIGPEAVQKDESLNVASASAVSAAALNLE